MSLGNNIFNAFEVVAKTYENVNKLMEYCKAMTAEKGEYTLVSPKFLRWRSDNNVYGWALTSFILLFQHENDELLENTWRNGPIYLLEINLYEPEAHSVPMINIAKYEYEDISSWSEGCSPANHWVFYHPLYSDELNYELSEEGTHYDGHVKDAKATDGKWWGLRRIVGFELPLTEINFENAYDRIFGGFNSLISK